MTAQDIAEVLSRLRGGDMLLDKKTTSLIDAIFAESAVLQGEAPDDRKELYVRAPIRTPVWKTRRAWRDHASGSTSDPAPDPEECIRWERVVFPEEREYYHLSLFSGDARAIFFDWQLIVLDAPSQEEPEREACTRKALATRMERGDFYPFFRWLLSAVKSSIRTIREGRYLPEVLEKIPYRKRFGTISRKQYWDLFPGLRRFYLQGLTADEMTVFLHRIRAQSVHSGCTRHFRRMTAGTYFTFCGLGYQRNAYPGLEGLDGAQQYARMADGRDAGLLSLKPDSAEAFDAWYRTRPRAGERPWDVVGGSGGSFISLRVIRDERGYYLLLLGRSQLRMAEVVRFYLALTDERIPVYLMDSAAIAARLEEKDRIGIVPEPLLPLYCESCFPSQTILDFMHLPPEKTREVIALASWEEPESASLLEACA